jgi:hypothetical protein
MGSLKRRVFLNLIIAVGCLAFFVFFGGLTHISASEFWPISLSKLVLSSGMSDTGIFLKPVFHVLLSFIYFFPLSGWDHILAARILFSIIAFLTCAIFVNWQLRINVKNGQVGRHLFFFLLFLSPVFLAQVVKVRSDMLALFFSVILISIGSIAKPVYSSKRFLLLATVNLFLLASTPRALIHDIVVVGFLLMYHWKSLRGNPEGQRQYLIAFGIPYLAVAYICKPDGIASAFLLPYVRQSYATSFFECGQVYNWIAADPVGFVFSLLGFLISLWQMFRSQHWLNELPWLFLFVGGCFGVFLADLKTPFLIASFYPFLLAPALRLVLVGGFAWTRSVRFVSIFALLWSVQFVFTQGAYFILTNQPQKEIILKLEQLLAEHPDFRYFDGLGILPRSNQMLVYLGPSDNISLDHALNLVKTERPDVFLYTSRTMLMSPYIDEVLAKNYKLIGPNIYLRNDKSGVNKIELASPPSVNFFL